MDKELKMQLLKEFRAEGIDFCKKAYDFITEEEVTHSDFTPPTEVKAVDLGLPSGNLWADRNVGAESEEDDGLWFSWGNIGGCDIKSYHEFSEKSYNESEGARIKSDINAPEHDAARMYMGGNWRMPTKEDFEELDEYCEHEWVDETYRKGMKFISKKNGKSIFFPASGGRSGTSLDDRGSHGYYWSSSLGSSAYGYDMHFNSGGVNPANYDDRFYGFSVRAVQHLSS